MTNGRSFNSESTGVSRPCGAGNILVSTCEACVRWYRPRAVPAVAGRGTGCVDGLRRRLSAYAFVSSHIKGEPRQGFAYSPSSIVSSSAMLRKGSLSVSATGARLHHSATDYQRFFKDIECHRHSLDDLATTIAHSQAFDSDASNFAPLIHAQVEASKAFVEHCAKTMRRYEEALGGTSKQNVLKRIYWRIHWHVSRSSAAAAEARWRMSEDRALCVAQLTSYVHFVLMDAVFCSVGLA